MSRQIFLGLLFSLILCAAGAKENCNKEEDPLQRCAMDLPVLNSPDFAITKDELDRSCMKRRKLDIFTAEQNNQSSDYIDYKYRSMWKKRLLTKQLVEELSPKLQSGIRCIENYTSACMNKHEQIIFRKMYAGVSVGLKELCTGGPYQDEYLKHASCIKNVRAEYELCSKKYEVTLTQLSASQKQDQYKTDQQDISLSHEDSLRTVCCSFQEFLSCSEQTVQRTCGDDAAVFTSKFLKQMAYNIMKNFCYEYRDQECAVPDKASHTYQNLQLMLLGLSGHLAFHLAGNLVPT